MGKIIGYIVFNIQSVIILASFLFSLKLFQNGAIPKYMKGFYWYPTIALLVLSPTFFTDFTNREYMKVCNYINNISILFHFAFLSTFILRVTPKINRYKKYFQFLFYLFLFLILIVLISNYLGKQVNQAFSISSFGLTIFCINYYYQLFNNIPKYDLKNEPSFWVVNGIFFCMSLHIPITSTVDYLQNKISRDLCNILLSILSFCYLVMHLFFIKAIVCSIRPRKAL